MTEDQKTSAVATLKTLYEAHYKKILILPAILVVLSLIVLTNVYLKTGDIIEKDVTLKGGITITVATQESVALATLQEKLRDRFGDANTRRVAEFGTDKQVGITAEVATEDEAALKQFLAAELNMEFTEDNYSVEIMGSTLGSAFYKQMVTAIIIAFILMSVVVFVMFRSFVPSMAVVLAALFDIIVALAVANLLGFRISTTGISAFLLLIGYSIDTDMLLTNRTLKRRGEGTLMDRVFSSINTGLTMTVTTIVALLAGIFVSESVAMEQMFTIILIGLIADVIMTYGMNAPILIAYAKKKGIQ